MSFWDIPLAFRANPLPNRETNFASSKQWIAPVHIHINLSQNIENMKRNIQWVFVAMAIFFASCSTGYKHLKTSKETGFSVRNYQTFGLQYTFPEGADTLAPLFAESKQLATQTVAGYMAGKGLVKSETPESPAKAEAGLTAAINDLMGKLQ